MPPARPINGAAPISTPKREPSRRGRPAAGDERVGRDVLIGVTRDLLRRMRPGELTRLRIAEAAGVDPRLIRYYFGTVDKLLCEIMMENNRLAVEAVRRVDDAMDAVEDFRARVGHVVDLFIENPFQHQLVTYVTSLEASSMEHRSWYEQLHKSVEDTADQIARLTSAEVARPVDPRMVHMVIIALGEIFGSNPDLVADIFDDREAVHTLRDSYVDFIVDLLLRGVLR